YPCRDQIGRIRDALFTGDETAPQTELAPMYFWQNFSGSTQYVPDLSNTDGFMVQHIVQNRDWYTQNTSFDGGTAVGVGTLAQRPPTCASGVAYWAVDEGEWNSKNSGPDGQLYKCATTNTWTLYYIPYTYPHPLTGGSTPNSTPSAPTNLRIVS